MVLTWIVIDGLVAAILGAKQASARVWGIAFAVLLVLMTFLSSHHYFFKILSWAVFLALYLPLGLPSLRKTYLTKKVLSYFRSVTPTLSETEKQVIEAGAVGWEGDIFSGSLDWQKLLGLTKPVLTAEEQAFLDGPVLKLCQLLNDFQITHELYDIPKAAWDLIKAEGFFGLIIPKKFGGKEFSAFAHAEIIAKIATRSTSAATIVSVPNSLGPAELLLHYGTEEQKNYYLPRLAKGQEIPCFALTSPVAGSDASSITDHGVVCERTFEGKKQLGILLTWEKRYITLAPVATVLGLAFKLYDPEHLLGDQEALGITCALIPTQTKGVEIGRRHFPLNSAFPNGPTSGHEIFIPMDWVIGGRAMVGHGWQMLMECLAAGRAISIPSGAVGGAMLNVATTGAYARIRRQFRLPIGQFGGVQEALARVLGFTYLANAIRHFTVAAVDRKEASAVASAICKLQCSDLSRRVINDVMDIQGGKGICLGPNNLAGRSYQQAPIGITVEGANILTRSMIIFGQGAFRAHPYVLAEIKAAAETDEETALRDFDRAFFAHLGLIVSAKIRSFAFALTDAHFIPAPVGPLKRYYQHLSHYCSSFVFIANCCMMIYGGELKRNEQQSGRLADLLSDIYRGCALLKYFEDRQLKEEDLPIVAWALDYALYEFERSLQAVIQNIPVKAWRYSLQMILLPLGLRRRLPSDKRTRAVAEKMITPNLAVDKLCEWVDMNWSLDDPISRCRAALLRVIAVEPIEKKLETALKSGKIKGKTLQEAVAAAIKENFLTAAQGKDLLEADELRRKVIDVDDFAFDELTRQFLQNTKTRHTQVKSVEN